MAASDVQNFVDALERIERSREHDAMESLFSEDCVVGNVLGPERFHGRDGAARFWRDYRGSFGEIRSEFHSRVEADGKAALEWVAQGTTPGGDPVQYQGISVLEFADGRIKRFMSYFDPRSLGRQFDATAE